jgi:5-formyltetrahydrofolate cyclo-ligase
LGQGRGYYDRLLPRLRPDATIVGLAFQAQILPQIPAEEHDVQMHCVVTETSVYGNLVSGR